VRRKIRTSAAEAGGRWRLYGGAEAPPYKALGFDDAFESVLNLVMRKLCAWLMRGGCYVGEPPGGRLPLRVIVGSSRFETLRDHREALLQTGRHDASPNANRLAGWFRRIECQVSRAGGSETRPYGLGVFVWDAAALTMTSHNDKKDCRLRIARAGCRPRRSSRGIYAFVSLAYVGPVLILSSGSFYSIKFH
jgi:hypothetical protein